MANRIGEQLLLGLVVTGAENAQPVPWGGRSPRALTRGYELGILKAQAAKEHGRIDLSVQIEMWPERQKDPFVYEGAPLLGSPLD